MRTKSLSLVLFLALSLAQAQSVCSNACKPASIAQVQQCVNAVLPDIGIPCVDLPDQASFDACLMEACPDLGAFLGASNPQCGFCVTNYQPNETNADVINRCTGHPYNAADAFLCRPSDAFQIRYAVNLNQGDSVINLTNTGAASEGPLFAESEDPSGNLCVNVYAFSPEEEQLSCCSCTVTPNGLASLSVQDDLLSNTLSPESPESVVIELTASVPAVSGTCDPAAPGDPAPGLVAWGTTLHAITSGNTSLQTTESPFLKAIPSMAGFTSLTSFCGFIESNGSGYGICKSCRSGGLAGAKK